MSARVICVLGTSWAALRIQEMYATATIPNGLDMPKPRSLSDGNRKKQMGKAMSPTASTARTQSMASIMVGAKPPLP